jgi:PGF-pre-PGF domain-containing protein
MNKYFSAFLVLLSIMVLVAVYPATAVTINSVKVAEPDTLYSSVANNSIVKLIVNVTGANNTPGNTVSVIANFISLDADCTGSGNSEISLAQSGSSDLWMGICDVGDEAAASTFKSGQIIVIANETYGSPSVNTSLVLSIYNIAVPSGTSCYRFGDGTTNFNDVTNFNGVDITLIIEANADSACTGKVMSWGGNSWLKVGKLQFNGVNFDDRTSDVQKLSQLSNIVKFKFSIPKTYQNTRFSVDTVALPELNVNTFNVELYHLSLLTSNNDSIVSDNNVDAVGITWDFNGFESMMDANTYNLSFTLNKGFKGYTITDSLNPVGILSSPTNAFTTNASFITVNFTVNGTGTSISKVLFNVNGVAVASYNGSINTANCTPVNQNIELYNCVFNLARTDGTYNLNVSAYDFGGATGNVFTTNAIYNVQTGAPVIKITLPKNDATYSGINGSMLKLAFNVTDGNGVSACWYSLDGPVSATNKLISSCVSGTNTLQLYLDSGSYDLTVYSNDTLGVVGTAVASFDVSDTIAPKILNYTVKIVRDDATLTILTDESALCKYGNSDKTYARMNDDFSDNITVHTQVFDVSDRNSDTLSGNEYVYYIRCSDLSENTNSNSLVVNLLNVNASLNVSNKTVANISNVIIEPSKSFDLGLLLAGKKILNIDTVGIPFTDMLLTTNSAADDVTLKVIALSNSTIVYPGKVYSYISIEHSGLKDSIIDDVLVKFKVSKKWLADNNFSRNDTVLLRYDGKWVILNTTAGADSGDYVMYTANSPGLSLFAISKKYVEVKAPVNTSTPNVTNTSNLNVTVNTPDTDKKSSSWVWIILGIIVFIVALLFILIDRNERSGPPPIFQQDMSIIERIKRLFR